MSGLPCPTTGLHVFISKCEKQTLWWPLSCLPSLGTPGSMQSCPFIKAEQDIPIRRKTTSTTESITVGGHPYGAGAVMLLLDAFIGRRTNDKPSLIKQSQWFLSISFTSEFWFKFSHLQTTVFLIGWILLVLFPHRSQLFESLSVRLLQDSSIVGTSSYFWDVLHLRSVSFCCATTLAGSQILILLT